MRTWTGIALAGGMGALARYSLGELIARRFPSFPWGTLVINVTGSFLLGALFVLLTERVAAPPVWRSSMLIGFIGAYTTFSTFSFETLRLLEDGLTTKAGLNVIGNVGLGLGAAWLGMVLGGMV